MHVLFVERHGLEETEIPTDLDQTGADLVVLSFSDSDLGAFAEGWKRGSTLQGDDFPTLRLANLSALKHPVSVDTYLEKTLSKAKGILVRLIGGVPYWSYGLQEVAKLAKRNKIAFAVLPADGREDPQLDDFSTLPSSTLRRLKELCDTGGAIAAHAALAQLALAAGLYAAPVRGTKTLETFGAWTPEQQVCSPSEAAQEIKSDKPLIILTFYRSFITAADLKPIEALFEALRARGFELIGLFSPSLKIPDAADWIITQIKQFKPCLLYTSPSPRDRG